MNDHDPFEDQLAARMKAATGNVGVSDDLDTAVSRRVQARARRSTAIRLGTIAAVVAITMTGVAWSRSASSPATLSPGATNETTPIDTGASDTVSSDTGASDASVSTDTGESMQPGDPLVVESFPAANPEAINILVTGSDNNSCVDADDPSASTLLDRDGLGQRTDTIMIIRVDPTTNSAAMLSFTRDLWVAIAGTDTKSRINGALVEGDPQRLIDTILLNFAIPIHHYIGLDFCGFTTLVDAVGGVAVPFEYAARDDHSGLDVPQPGCYTFDGDAALSYVRSRHYQYLDPVTNDYREDPSGDIGRIGRQQDFVRRLVTAVVANGFSPTSALDLIDIAQQHVITDPGLTPDIALRLAGVLRNVAAVGTYQIEVVGRSIAGNAVLEPQLDGKHMQSVLGVFRGELPVPIGSQPPSPGSDATGATGATVASGASSPSDGEPIIEQHVRGIVPPVDVVC